MAGKMEANAEKLARRGAVSFLFFLCLGTAGCGGGDCTTTWTPREVRVLEHEECPRGGEASWDIYLGDGLEIEPRQYSAPVTICWYEREGEGYCSGDRWAMRQQAESCEPVSQPLESGRVDICGEQEDTRLHGVIYRMDDVDEEVWCPSVSPLWESAGTYVGRDVYPGCATCTVLARTSYVCGSGHLGGWPLVGGL